MKDLIRSTRIKQKLESIEQNDPDLDYFRAIAKVINSKMWRRYCLLCRMTGQEKMPFTEQLCEYLLGFDDIAFENTLDEFFAAKSQTNGGGI